MEEPSDIQTDAGHGLDTNPGTDCSPDIALGTDSSDEVTSSADESACNSETTRTRREPRVGTDSSDEVASSADESAYHSETNRTRRERSSTEPTNSPGLPPSKTHLPETSSSTSPTAQPTSLRARPGNGVGAKEDVSSLKENAEPSKPPTINTGNNENVRVLRPRPYTSATSEVGSLIRFSSARPTHTPAVVEEAENKLVVCRS